MRRIVYLAATTAAFAALCVSARISQAQITEDIVANISHSFIVNNTTLPPGKYTFHMIHQTEETVMRVSSADGRKVTDFMVRDSIDDHLPMHSELVFNRYGNKEFLTRLYEAGTKTGAAVINISKDETDLTAHGQAATTHSEEQER